MNKNKKKKKKKTFNKLCKEALSRSNRSPVNKSKKQLQKKLIIDRQTKY